MPAPRQWKEWFSCADLPMSAMASRADFHVAGIDHRAEAASAVFIILMLSVFAMLLIADHVRVGREFSLVAAGTHERGPPGRPFLPGRALPAVLCRRMHRAAAPPQA